MLVRKNSGRWEARVPYFSLILGSIFWFHTQLPAEGFQFFCFYFHLLFFRGKKKLEIWMQIHLHKLGSFRIGWSKAKHTLPNPVCNHGAGCHAFPRETRLSQGTWPCSLKLFLRLIAWELKNSCQSRWKPSRNVRCGCLGGKAVVDVVKVSTKRIFKLKIDGNTTANVGRCRLRFWIQNYRKAILLVEKVQFCLVIHRTCI